MALSPACRAGRGDPAIVVRQGQPHELQSGRAIVLSVSLSNGRGSAAALSAVRCNLLLGGGVHQYRPVKPGDVSVLSDAGTDIPKINRLLASVQAERFTDQCCHCGKT